LHPPFGLGEIIERVHGEIGVGVVDRRVIAALQSQNGTVSYRRRFTLQYMPLFQEAM
jgi:hypothetical protein